MRIALLCLGKKRDSLRKSRLRYINISMAQGFKFALLSAAAIEPNERSVQLVTTGTTFYQSATGQSGPQISLSATETVNPNTQLGSSFHSTDNKIYGLLYNGGDNTGAGSQVTFKLQTGRGATFNFFADGDFVGTDVALLYREGGRLGFGATYSGLTTAAAGNPVVLSGYGVAVGPEFRRKRQLGY